MKETKTIIKECIDDIDVQIKKASKSQDGGKMTGLVVAKYILIGKLDEEERHEYQ